MADSVTFRFSGGEQFVLDLHRWRDRLRGEVHTAAQTEAQRLAQTVRAAYPRRTGNLQRGVRVTDDAPTGDAIAFRVRSLARHSHLYEKGTTFRQTRRGADRGVMPATPLFIPEAILRRTAFKASVRRILGSGEPAIGSGSPTVTGSL